MNINDNEICEFAYFVKDLDQALTMQAKLNLFRSVRNSVPRETITENHQTVTEFEVEYGKKFTETNINKLFMNPYRTALYANRKIAAIKELRYILKIGLKAAKDVTEYDMVRLGIDNSQPF